MKIADALTGPLAVVLVTLAVAGLSVWLAGRAGRPLRQPYQKHAALFSAEEQALFHLLREAVGGDYQIFGKIPADAIIVPKPGATRAASAVISGRYFDFVLCDNSSLAALCVIVLYDDPNAEPDPLEPICESLSLPFLRFSAGVDHTGNDVRQRLRERMAETPLIWAESDGRKEPRISNLDDMQF